MTMLTRWETHPTFPLFPERMNQFFQEAFRWPYWSTDGENGITRFAPPADICEDHDSIRVFVEVPGLSEADFDITLQNNVLTVRGERKLEKDEKMENFHRVERYYGAFSRSFVLPSTVDPDSVNATYVNGVLQIQVAKRAEARPRQIPVRSGQRTLEQAKAA